MGQTLRVIAGTDGGPWASTLLNAGVPVAFPSDATFTASVWRGGEEASLFSPAVSWIIAAAGTFQISIAAADTTNLDVGVYRFEINVVSSGITSNAFNGQLEVIDAPGEVATRVPYVQLWDLRRYYDQIDILRNNMSDTTGFLDVRINESDEFDRDIVLRYRNEAGFGRTRQSPPNPVLGEDVHDPTASYPSSADVSGYLKAGGLILDRYAREMVARRVIADILDRQETSGRNSYRDEAKAMRDMADAIWCDTQGRPWQAQIDTSDPLDGVADVLIDRNAILLPEGTAP